MKKILMIALGAALVLSLTACGGKQAEPASADGSVEIPNPYQDFDTLEEASAAAGFDLTVPDAIDGYSEKIIRALVTDDCKMIEVIYEKDEEQEIRIRKAVGSEDISGDYNEYEQSDKVTAGEKEVTMKGNDGAVYLATWTDSDYTFSVSVSAGMSGEALSELISAIQ